VKTITLDLETTSLDPFTGEIVLIGYRFNGSGPVTVLDVTKGEDNENLRVALADREVVLRGHNIKFDALFLGTHGYVVNCILDDTRILSYLNCPFDEHDLKSMVESKLHRPVRRLKDLELEAIIEKSLKKNRRVATVDLNRADLIEYNKDDVTNCDDIKKYLPSTDWYKKVEQPLLRMLYDTELRGCNIDKPYLEALDEEYKKELAIIRGRLGEFNPNSPKQVIGQFRERGVNLERHTKKTPGGQPKVDKIFLKRRTWGGDTFARDLLRHRELAKLRSTYTSGLLERLVYTPGVGDFRLHGSFNQAGREDKYGSDSQGTATGRLTSSGPNLQNIPIRTLDGKRVRQSFIASEGYRMFDTDLKQIEPRLIAHYSQSSKLIHAYNNGLDTHGMFGADIFKKSVKELTKIERFIGKTSWLATVYGCGYKKLLTICETNSDDPLELNLEPFRGLWDRAGHLVKMRYIRSSPSEQAAKEEYAKHMFFKNVQDTFMAANPEIMNWRATHIARVKRNGYLTTFGGRIIKAPEELYSANEFERYKGERLVVNYQIQGSAADIMKLILVKFKERIIDKGIGHMLAVVHDEILGEFREDMRENVMSYGIKKIMNETVKLNNVPIDCDYSVCDSWAEK